MFSRKTFSIDFVKFSMLYYNIKNSGGEFTLRKTKIVCTLGPSTDNVNILKELMLNGMDVVRINVSHQDHQKHLERVEMVKSLREKLDLPIALLLDTKGPEIRIGKFKLDKIELKKGQTFTLTSDELLGDSSIVSVSFKNLINEVMVGTKILIDDGLIGLLVKKIENKNIICKVLNSGFLSANKSINIPGIKLSIPFIDKKDIDDIKFAVEQDFDFIAASFTRSADDIIKLQKELSKFGGNNIKIIAKIENSDGINNIDEIIKISDGIMVARGDLGVEVPLENIPIIQKQLIKKACDAGKHVITATQMLDSMIKNPRPTRAEVNDVANAIYDGTGAIMLSGETAAGFYPIEAVKIMASIAKKTESDVDYKERFFKLPIESKKAIPSAVSHATCTTAIDLGAAFILTVTKSGTTAQFVSRYRPNCPIIACSTEASVVRQMNLLWGVIPLKIKKEGENLNQLFDNAINAAYEKKYIKSGDLVIITAGLPLGHVYGTNFLKVHVVGKTLIWGDGINNASIKGRLCICKSESEALKKFQFGDILVIPEVSKRLIKIIDNASAVIVEASSVNFYASIPEISYNKPIITGAKNATNILKDGNFVTVDAQRGIVFED